MKWLPRVLFVLALGVVASVLWMVAGSRDESPEGYFGELLHELDGGNLDTEQILVGLDRALELASQAGNEGLAARIRRRRGEALMEVGAFHQAREDFEGVLRLQPRNREVRRLLVDLEGRAGNVDEGLRRARALVEAHPDFAEAHQLLGRLHVLSAEAQLELARGVLDMTLIAEDAERGFELARTAAALDAEDPRRVAYGHRLDELFSPRDQGRLEQVLTAVDAASAQSERARHAYAQSLTLDLDPDSVASLMESLVRGERLDEAIDLGAVALRYPEAQEELAIVTLMAEALAGRARDPYAGAVLSRWSSSQRPAPQEFLLQAARQLYEVGDIHNMAVAANRFLIIADAERRDLGYFYMGLFEVETSNYERGLFHLQRFLRAPGEPEPFPGARLAARQRVAEGARALGDAAHEREALEGIVQADPEADADLWLRLAELQLESRHAGYRIPETRWAHGMARAPERTQELLPRWIEIGERELSAAGIDVDVVRQEMVRNRAWAPPATASPYELYRLTQTHLAAGDVQRAAQSCSLLLEKVPGFVPALDLAVPLELQMGKPRAAAERYLERFEAVGRDALSVELYGRIPAGTWQPGDVLRRMRVDPATTGRLEIARTHATLGEPERALGMLGDLERADISDEERLLAAEILLDLDRGAAALGVLSGLDGRQRAVAGRLLPMLIRACLGSGDRERLTTFVQQLERTQPVRPVEWFGLVDELVEAGFPRLALLLLRRMDDDPAPAPSEVLVRMGRAALLADEDELARRSIERAEAFDDSGAPELLRLLRALRDGAFDEAAAGVADLRATRFQPSPLQAAALALVAGETRAAADDVERGLAEAPHEPLWGLLAVVRQALADEELAPPEALGGQVLYPTAQFLRGTSDEFRDPRWTLGVVLTIERREWSPWAQHLLDGLAEGDGGALWPGYLSGSIAATRGQARRVRGTLGPVTRQWPGFAPAWAKLESAGVPADTPPDDPARLKLRRMRLAALGEEAGDSVEVLVDRARLAWEQGDAREALSLAHEATNVEPRSFAAQATLARLLAERGWLAEALEAYGRALRVAPQESDGSFVPELLDLARRVDAAAGREEDAPGAARPGSEVAPAEVTEFLSRAARQLPGDPLLAVALARRELVADPNNPTLGVARALARLERFQSEHPDTPLDRLRRGATEEWVEFFLGVDAVQAEVLLERQRLLLPGLLDLWVLLGEVYHAQGRIADAEEHLRTVDRMVTDREIVRRLAWVVADAGADPVEVRELAKRVYLLSDSSAPSPELQLLRAHALYATGPRAFDAARALLEPLWKRREAAPPDTDLVHMGRLYAVLLLARGSADDRALAREVLLETEARTLDPYARDLMLALRGMSLHDPDAGLSTAPPEAPPEDVEPVAGG